MSVEAISPLKRKALFRRLSFESMKKIRLDPAPEPADSTIALYHERTQALMPKDRDKLHIQIPFDQDLLHIRDLQALKPRTELLEAKLRELSGVQEELSGVQRELSGLSGVQGELNNMLENRLSMLIANALIDLARKVAKTYKPELNNDQSTTRLQQFAANVTDTQLENIKIPRKFWGVLRKLDKVITARNQQAHETRIEFAQVISRKHFKESFVFEKWKDIFPLLYGESVEVLAAQKEEADRMLLGML